MLPVQHRLTDSGTFRTVVRRGRRAGSATLVVHLWVDPEAPARPVSVGFTVGRTVGPAVVRNLVRRRLRHLLRDRLGELEDLPGGHALVVRAQPAAAASTYAVLGADLDRCLRRVTP